jgi:hypothetical protein
MTKLYFVVALFSQSAAVDVTHDVCSQEGLGSCRNSQALLQVATSTLHKHRTTIQQPALGAAASLDQGGYQTVVDDCCPAQMMAFIRQIINSQGLYVCAGAEGALAGFAQYFDCADDGQDYAKLLAELDVAKTGECAWIGALPDCPRPPVTCGDFPDVPLPPCNSPCSQTDFFPFGFKGPVFSNLGGYGPDTDKPQELRFTKIGKLNKAPVDLVVKNLSPIAEGTVPEAGAASGGLMGKIHVRGGTSVEFLFTFVVSGSDTPVNPPPREVHLSFLDIDSSIEGKMQEKIHFDQICMVKAEADPDFELTKGPDGRDLITSSVGGPGCNNPKDPMNLDVANVCEDKGVKFTTNQRKRTAMGIIKGSSSFTVKLETTCDGKCKSGRQYYFAGNSALADLCTEA